MDRALQRAWRGALTVAMGAIGLVMIFPIVWSFFTAFKPNSEAASASPTLLPQTWTLQNFVEIWSAIPFAQLYGNTILFAGAVMVLSLAFDTMAGYALARFEFRGRTAAFIAIIVMLMIPYQAVIIPLYDLVHSLGLGQTMAGMIIPERRMPSACSSCGSSSWRCHGTWKRPPGSTAPASGRSSPG